MHTSIYPQGSGGPLYRVRASFRSGIGRRFGVLYSNACLIRDEDVDGHATYAPVCLLDDDVHLPSWPAVAMRMEWVERIFSQQEPDQSNVEQLNQAR